MAERRGRSRQFQRNPLDQDNPQNWTSTKLKRELSTLGISVPNSMDRNNVLKLYIENRNNGVPRRGHVTNLGTNSQNPASANTVSTPDANVSPHTAEESGSADTGIDTSHANPSDSDTGNGNLQATILDLSRRVAELQETVTNIPRLRMPEYVNSGFPSANAQGYNLQTAMASAGPRLPEDQSPFSGGFNYSTLQLHRTRFGVPSEALPLIDVVSESLKKKIWDGKDVNLASLLIPKFEASKESLSILDAFQPEDPRLHKSLNIAEFITAFGKYKRVMCMKYPERQVELDRYEANIIQISNVYGHKFYEYHTQFSARAAAALADCNIKIDWSIKDNSLLTMVAGNANVVSCQLCSATSHSTSFCPLVASKAHPHLKGPISSSTLPKDTDKYGRPRKSHNGNEICNNFNSGKCTRKNCSFSHLCHKCKATDHGAASCEGPTKKSK